MAPEAIFMGSCGGGVGFGSANGEKGRVLRHGAAAGPSRGASSGVRWCFKCEDWRSGQVGRRPWCVDFARPKKLRGGFPASGGEDGRNGRDRQRQKSSQDGHGEGLCEVGDGRSEPGVRHPRWLCVGCGSLIMAEGASHSPCETFGQWKDGVRRSIEFVKMVGARENRWWCIWRK